MNREIWLRTNGRASLAAAILTAIGSLNCGLVAAFSAQMTVFWTSVAGCAVLAMLCLVFVWRSRQPRLAYRDGWLAVYLIGWQPILVPIDVVECFFLGQGLSGLPQSPLGNTDDKVAMRTVVVRLAEAAHDWKHRTVRPALGLWCESYITILGTWCEPLGTDVVARLNRRLVEVQRLARQKGSP